MIKKERAEIWNLVKISIFKLLNIEIMWKYNKYNIGDVVGHKQSPTLKFRVTGVLSGVPEKKGTYSYGYSQMFDEDEPNDMKEIFYALYGSVYMEKDLFFIRKPTIDELHKMLKEALIQKNEFHLIAKDLRNKIKSVEIE